MSLILEIVTPEARVYSDTVETVVIPTLDGEIGILPGHIPLLTEADGSKLAKSRRSLPLDPVLAPALLHRALVLLGQCPPAELAGAGVAECWNWACAHWDPAAIAGRKQLALAAGLY